MQLVLVPCRNSDGTPADTSTGGAADFCALFYSLHVAGDGHTHYRLLSMFSSEQQIKSLNSAQTFALNEKTKKMLGYDGLGWVIKSAASTLYMAYNCTFGKKAKYCTLYVDQAKVASLKAEAAAASGDVSFVSTNDVLMSRLAKLTMARILLTAVNFRDCVPGIVDSGAGNQESFMLFYQALYKTPATIRTALNALKKKAAEVEGVERERNSISSDVVSRHSRCQAR